MLQTPPSILGLPRWTWAVLAAWAGTAILVHAFGYHTLYHDEVYYWTWSRRPLEWGYFSKPPLIAWCHALTTAVSGNTVLGLRSWVIAMNAGTVLLGGMLAFEATRRTAAAIAAMALLLLMTNFVADTNKPQNLFWMLTLFAAWRAVSQSPRYWLLAGASLGLGILGKHTVASLLPVLAIFTARHARSHLRHPAFWGGFALMLAILAPHLLWLAQHQAVTVLHTAGLGSVDASFDLATLPATIAGFARSQITITGGIGWFVLLAAAAWGISRQRSQDRTPLLALLLLAWALPFGFYAVWFTVRAGLPHWFLPSYLSLAVIAGLWAGAARSHWRYRAAAVLFSLSIVVATGNAIDPGGARQGRIFAERLENVLEQYDADFVFSYGSSPRYLAWAEFFLDGQPFCRSLFLGELASQYSFWQDAWEDAQGQDGILIAPGPEHYARERIEEFVERGFFLSGKYIKTITAENDDGDFMWQVSLCLMRSYTGKRVPLTDEAPISTRFAGILEASPIPI